ncbi:MAG: hypothetical protein Q9166_004916 [cf. Caloplaca sp. 2 TL-2023]
MAEKRKHALVFGDAFWPVESAERPVFQLVSGIDLAEGTAESVTELLKTNVKGIEYVTHVLYFVYKFEEKPEDEGRVVCGMPERAVGAMNRLSPDLEFLVFPSGTKIRFVPSSPAFNLTGHWATYLFLYALIEGRGARIPFPGTLKAYNSLHNEASADIIDKAAIGASLNPALAGGGQIFNITDQAKVESMRERWPKLAVYFGLEGIEPIEDSEVLKSSEYIKMHHDALEASGVKSNPVFKGEFMDSYGYYLDFDRQLSLEKMREAGFMEEMDPNESWFKAFGGFKEAGMIAGWLSISR